MQTAPAAPGDPSTEDPPCQICGAHSHPIGSVYGRYSKRNYRLRRCPDCHFAFIADPWLEFDRIYDERYYAGEGADPMVDYKFELERPRDTVRAYEWTGIGRMARELMGDLQGLRWLDFGCGGGGLVRHLNATTAVRACGFEEGAIARAAERIGIPILSASQLANEEATFDVVSAIEVLEHTAQPLTVLRVIRRVLRRGGLLLLTTGNAKPFAEKLTRWSYVTPEVHVSFFEPATLETAMRRTGFRPERRPRGAGFDEVLKFKVLKNLHVRRRSRLTDLLPARLLGPPADRVRRLSEQPVGWAE
jgi:2-polyprenyl-3-methyl-5-hydroxy-6-metoxy-1,4-benzoquinol methylase